MLYVPVPLRRKIAVPAASVPAPVPQYGINTGQDINMLNAGMKSWQRIPSMKLGSIV
jgi:hypothetical protein